VHLSEDERAVNAVSRCCVRAWSVSAVSRRRVVVAVDMFIHPSIHQSASQPVPLIFLTVALSR